MTSWRLRFASGFGLAAFALALPLVRTLVDAPEFFVAHDLGRGGTMVYLVGLIKSFRFRPVLLTAEGVRVRAGFLIDQLVPFDAIVAVDAGFTGEEVRDAATLNAALLAWPNVMLRLDRPLPRRSWRSPCARSMGSSSSGSRCGRSRAADRTRG